MKILIIADIHNDVEMLSQMMDKLENLEFDLIICPGDWTNYLMPEGFTRREIAHLIIEEFKTLGKPILALPGNLDRDIIPLLEEEGISLHGKGKLMEGVGFYGYGGAATPFATPLEPSEDEIKENLTKAFEQLKGFDFLVQVTHVPPARTQLDRLLSGAHVGSEAVREFIQIHRPTIAICAHIHEARGVDRLDDTRIINPGRFPEGYCGIATVEKGNIDVKITNLAEFS